MNNQEYYERYKERIIKNVKDHYHRNNYKVGCMRCGSVVNKYTFYYSHRHSKKCIKYGTDKKNWYIYNGRYNADYEK